MPKIIEYIVIESCHVDELNSQIKKKIDSGFQPYGNLNITKLDHPIITRYPCFSYQQAFVKYADAD